MTLEEARQVFGENLATRRSELGLSQSELARRAGVPQPLISDFERGERSPAFETILKLAQGLGVPPDLLLRSRAFSAAGA